jgi:hypothetical protein
VSTVGFESMGSELEALGTGGATGSLSGTMTGTGAKSDAGVAGGSCF